LRKRQVAAALEKHHALRQERLGEKNDVGGEA
jgi:hypothetical protein